MKPITDGWGRGRLLAVRVLGGLGILTFNFMFVLVALDAAGHTGGAAALIPAGSPQAQAGADHPGETVHLVGALAALAVATSGLIGLVARPRSVAAATQVGAAALGSIAAVLVMGDPDNHGGQAGAVDPVFLAMAVPVLAAAVVAAPWRSWRPVGDARRRPLLVLAALALPAAWFGMDQALMQRNTWPPLADPHHQSHWYAMAVLGFMVVPVVAGAALAGRRSRVAPTITGAAAAVVAAASLAAPTAASALHPGWAAAVLLWGVALLTVTWKESGVASVPALTSGGQR